MTEQVPSRPTRALVLGGGGVTGIAWEIGVLAGLATSGIDLAQADAVIGTSAGSFVGAAVASGYDLETLASAQAEPETEEISTTASEETVTAWFHAFAAGNAESVGAAFGSIARANPEPFPREARRKVIEHRLVTDTWPPSLQVTAVDADSGVLHVFDHASGIALVDAVMASGAVPGVWPLVRINGRSWIDGGMVSSANARLADGYQRVLVLAPMPAGYGAVPGVEADVAALQTDARAVLLTPDEESIRAIGPNPYDASRRAPAASAGRSQGVRLAREVGDVW